MRFEECLDLVRTFLARSSPGVRVIVTHPGSVPKEPAADLFEACRSSAIAAEGDSRLQGSRMLEWTSLHLECHPEGCLEIRDSDDGHGFPSDGLPERVQISDLPRIITSMGSAPAIYLGNAQAFTFEEMANLLGSIRDKRNDGCRARVFICGAWAPQSFIQTWKTQRDGQSSPLDNKINWLAGYTPENIKTQIQHYLNGVPNDHLDVLVEMIMSHTAGDARFVDYLLQELQECPPPSGAAGLWRLEHDLSGLATQGSLQDQIWEKVDGLPPAAIRILEATLRYQVIRMDEKDLACEILAIRGLLSSPEGPGGIINWKPASPVIASILRESWCSRFPDAPPFPPESEMIPIVLPVAAPAQALVTRIENTLRNLVLLSFSVNFEGHPLEQAPSINNELLYAKATLARDEDELAYDSRLFSRQLTSFLDTSEVFSLIVHGECYPEFFKAIFPDKGALLPRFEAFQAIRRAVAHNKVLSIKVLNDLDEHLTFFDRHLGTAAAESLKEDARELVELVASRLEGKSGRFKVLGSAIAKQGLTVDVRGRAIGEAGQEVVSRVKRVFLETGKTRQLALALAPTSFNLQPESGEVQVIRARPLSERPL